MTYRISARGISTTVVEDFGTAAVMWNEIRATVPETAICVFDEYGDEVWPEVMAAWFEPDIDIHDEPPVMSLDDLTVIAVAVARR